MNIFRLAGDMVHLASIVLLLLKIHGTRSCAGTWSLASAFLSPSPSYVLFKYRFVSRKARCFGKMYVNERLPFLFPIFQFALYTQANHL